MMRLVQRGAIGLAAMNRVTIDHGGVGTSAPGVWVVRFISLRVDKVGQWCPDAPVQDADVGTTRGDIM